MRRFVSDKFAFYESVLAERLRCADKILHLILHDRAIRVIAVKAKYAELHFFNLINVFIYESLFFVTNLNVDYGVLGFWGCSKKNAT